MKLTILCICLHCFVFAPNLFAQSFSSVGLCKVAGGVGVRGMYADNANNLLYAAGAFLNLNGNDTLVDAIAAWDGQQWTGVNGVNDHLKKYSKGRKITKFKNEVYLIGEIGDGATYNYGIVKYVNNDWQPIEDSTYFNQTLYDLLATDSLLYIVGQFDTLGSVLSHCIMQYDGTNFYPLPPMGDILASQAAVMAVELYKGELYVGGNIEFLPGTPKQDILRWNGAQWNEVGGGLSGGATAVQDFCIYKDKLIVAGYFEKNFGDPGNSCAAWDGNNWTAMDLWTNPNPFSGFIRALKIFKEELYCVGIVPGNSLSSLYKWNDTTGWQLIGNIPYTNGEALSLEVFNDELYLGGSFHNFAGLPYQGVIKYNSITGITSPLPTSALRLYPNPAKDHLQLKLDEALLSQNFTLSILDSQGKCLYQGKLQEVKQNIDLQGYASGLYYVVLENKERKMSTKFVKE